MSADTIAAGRYEIEDRLGVGGMSTVHLALDSRLERHVAIKLLAEHLADDPSFISRFRREALSAAKLVHPNVVQVFDFGLDEQSDRHFIVMEYVPGQSCAEILRDRGHLSPQETLDIVRQSCRGLSYAHRNRVVHRDVKPGNLLVSDDGVVKLADFGIAKATEQSSITQAGSVLGTAAYLAPEQARGEEAGPVADVYSLGVVTYQLLTGRLPYEASSLTELALRQQREAPPPVESLNPEVSPGLAAAVLHALAIDPRERYGSAEDMDQGLVAGARDDGPAVTTADETGATSILMRKRDPTGATTALPNRGDKGGDGTRVEGQRTAAPAARRRPAAAAPVAPVEPRRARRRPAPVAPPPQQRPQPQQPQYQQPQPQHYPQPYREAAPAKPRGRKAKRAARRAAAPPPPPRAAKPRKTGRRAFTLLIVLIMVVVGAAIIVNNVTRETDKIDLERIVSDNVDQTVNDLKQLIDNNTR